MFSEYDTLNLAKLPPAQARIIRARRLVVERYEHVVRSVGRGGIGKALTGLIEQLRAEGTPVCRATVLRWHRDWRAHGTFGLADRRGLPDVPQPSPFLRVVARLRARRPRLTILESYERAKRWARLVRWDEVPTLAETRRFLALLNPHYTRHPAYRPDAIEWAICRRTLAVRSIDI